MYTSPVNGALCDLWSCNKEDDAGLVLEQIILSERLAPVISSEVGQVDGQAGSLVGASVLKTLVYLSTHHYAVAENLLHSPLAPRKIHRLTNKQFTWATL